MLFRSDLKRGEWNRPTPIIVSTKWPARRLAETSSNFPLAKLRGVGINASHSHHQHASAAIKAPGIFHTKYLSECTMNSFGAVVKSMRSADGVIYCASFGVVAIGVLVRTRGDLLYDTHLISKSKSNF